MDKCLLARPSLLPDWTIAPPSGGGQSQQEACRLVLYYLSNASTDIRQERKLTSDILQHLSTICVFKNNHFRPVKLTFFSSSQLRFQMRVDLKERKRRNVQRNATCRGLMLLHRRGLQQQLLSEVGLTDFISNQFEHIYTPRRDCRSTGANGDILKGLFVVPSPSQCAFR